MFKRGFKTYCEQVTEAVRRQLGLSVWEPLGALVLAESLKARVVTPDQLPTLAPDARHRLVNEHAEVWSAITISATPPLVVYNPTHKAARRNSDLMHEMAHLLLEHVPSTVYIDPRTRVALRRHDRQQEEQATWLAGCLLLPRAALVRIRQLRISDADACARYVVSLDMLRFRMGTSGVDIQFRRRTKLPRR
ncbi:MAG: ImmA/IrrE family metallo-endopeptidase [Terracidiphilus sp.]